MSFVLLPSIYLSYTVLLRSSATFVELYFSAVVPQAREENGSGVDDRDLRGRNPRWIEPTENHMCYGQEGVSTDRGLIERA